MRVKNKQKNFMGIISGINDLIKLISSLKNEKFKNFCYLFLNKKLYSYGLLENRKSIKENELKISQIYERTLIKIVVKKKFAKNEIEAKKIIKTGKIRFKNKIIKDHRILINRKMENSIILIKVK
jgi:ribosomal protein S4